MRVSCQFVSLRNSSIVAEMITYHSPTTALFKVRRKGHANFHVTLLTLELLGKRLNSQSLVTREGCCNELIVRPRVCRKKQQPGSKVTLVR